MGQLTLHSIKAQKRLIHLEVLLSIRYYVMYQFIEVRIELAYAKTEPAAFTNTIISNKFQDSLRRTLQ
jgi:hypothetical protein